MFPKILVPIVAVALLFVLACEEDSEVLDQFITVSIDGGAVVTYDSPISIMAFWNVTGEGASSDSAFYIYGMEDTTSAIMISFKGKTTGTYDVATFQAGELGGNNFDVMYFKSATEIYGFSRSGFVTVTAFGAVGELVEGTYEAMLMEFSADATAADSAQVSGSFSVKRKPDGMEM
jgi:uncharacterized protein (DUF2141 family)